MLDFRNYDAEISAFSHRIGAPKIPVEDLVQALTSESYATRADVGEGAEGAGPSKDERAEAHNLEMAQKGSELLNRHLGAYLRYHLSAAPEDLIQAVIGHLTNDALLAQIAQILGIDSLIRTAEHPPSQKSLADAFRGLAAAIGEEGARSLALNWLAPQLVDCDFDEVYPLREPLAVLTALLKRNGAQKVEPRVLRSIGEESAEPVYVVGIYKDEKEIVGQSSGETQLIAVEMAAREGLLRHWGVSADRVFFFGDRAHAVDLQPYERPNQRLSELAPGVDLSLLSPEEETGDPLNIVEQVLKYRNERYTEIGPTYVKRQRHKFSRGTLVRRSFRYLSKPRVYTMA